MIKIDPIKLKQVIISKGYEFYENNFKLNIIGIRKIEKVNVWDDVICLLYYNTIGVLKFHQHEATTEPGKPFLLKPINKKGTAILVEGQYTDTYQIDLHNGKYPALCQRLKQVKVYRDNNRDENFNFDPQSIESGFFGINLHRASKWQLLQYVDRNSAGCQVTRSNDDFQIMMSAAEIHKTYHGNKFTYTLINEKELI